MAQRAAKGRRKGPSRRRNDEENTRIAFETDGFAVVVCRHPDGRFLAVKETQNRGWWLPAGHVDRGQNFVEAAFRETHEEAGIHVDLKGVLGVEHSLSTLSSARMRVIFYGEPLDPDQPPKSVADKESDGAAWVTLDQLEDMRSRRMLRGEELLRWGQAVERGCLIAPLHISFAQDRDGSRYLLYDGFFRMEDNGPQPQAPVFRPYEHKHQPPQHPPPPQHQPPPPQPQPQPPQHGNRQQALTRAEGRRGRDGGGGGAEEGGLEGGRRGSLGAIRKGLLQNQYDPNRLVNQKRWVPLHIAAQDGDEELVRVLLLGGANPNLTTHKGRTPLHFAIGQESPEIVRLLLVSGANPSVPDVEGKTPLDYARIRPPSPHAAAILRLLSLA